MNLMEKIVKIQNSSLVKKINAKLQVDITPKNRFFLAIIWSVATISFCYISLFLSLTFLGTGDLADLISGDVYTFIPALMAVFFIVYFKTDILSWDKFKNPGYKWLLSGVAYTVVVLSLTIATDAFFGLIAVNPSYSPWTGDFQGYTTGNQSIDIIFYLFFIGILALFSPGGFVRIVGEEFGWRGYLYPELLKLHPKLSLVISTFIVGVVWFSFHLPYFTVLAPAAPNEIPYLIIGSIGVFFGANWFMIWTYLKTKSIWPAMILHYSWNLAAPVFTGNLYDGSLGLLNKSQTNLWLVNGEGLIGGTFHFMVGLVFLFLIYWQRDSLFESFKKIPAKKVTLPKKIRLTD